MEYIELVFILLIVYQASIYPDFPNSFQLPRCNSKYGPLLNWNCPHLHEKLYILTSLEQKRNLFPF